MQPRRKVELTNFAEGEDVCKCGACGKKVADRLMVSIQAYIVYMSRELKGTVTCVLSGPARCEKRQRHAYGILDKPEVQTPDSYHMGQNRIDEGTDSWAADLTLYVTKNGKRSTVPRAVAAAGAVSCKLFGGVGHKAYDGDGKDFIHVDLGPVREF